MEEPGVLASLSRRRSRVQIPSLARLRDTTTFVSLAAHHPAGVVWRSDAGAVTRESATGELAESGRLHPSRKRETAKVVREFKSLTRRAVVGTRGSVRTVLVDSLILW